MRDDLAAGLVKVLRRRGIRTVYPRGWEDYDARLLLSPFASGELLTSSHPEGFVQVRVRFKPRRRAMMVGALATMAALLVSPVLSLVVASAFVGGIAEGAIRARRLPGLVLPADAR